MTTPSITPAQILSTLTSFVGLLVSQGAVTNGTGKLIGGIASIVVPAAWQVADAIIRHGRAQVAAAQVGTPAPEVPFTLDPAEA